MEERTHEETKGRLKIYPGYEDKTEIQTIDNIVINSLRLGIQMALPRQCGEERTRKALEIYDELAKVYREKRDG